MARVLEGALPPASDREVAAWVESIAGEVLAARAREVANFERTAEAPDEEPSEDARTLERTAIVPPPLAPMREEAKTVPAFDLLAPPDVEPQTRAVPTPMSMVAPIDPLSQSGMSATRIEPVDSRRVPRMRTPIPMPAPLPARRPSALRLALVVATPPAIAAALVLFLRPVGSPDVSATAAHAPLAAPAPPPLADDPRPVILPSPPPPTATASSSPSPAHARAARPVSPSRAVRPHKR